MRAAAVDPCHIFQGLMGESWRRAPKIMDLLASLRGSEPWAPVLKVVYHGVIMGLIRRIAYQGEHGICF